MAFDLRLLVWLSPSFPVGSGKTALTEALCRPFRATYDLCGLASGGRAPWAWPLAFVSVIVFCALLFG